MDSLALIIFGITSNLAQIKLIPALYDMAEKGLLPENMVIIGNARKPLTKKEIEEYVARTLRSDNRHHQHEIKDQVVNDLVMKIHYLDGNLDDSNFYLKLKDFLNNLDKSGKGPKNHIFYLATYPQLYHHIFENLHAVGLNQQKNGWSRLMIEKPIGNDLKSAKKLNKLLLKYFSEDQLYRLDHYLGKETLQNILTFRFANGIFEPQINKEYIDHIQITAAENFGIGKRGGYFDSVGMLKDVGQNHQLQMLAFTTMDNPKEFTNRAVTDERIKILNKLVPFPKKVVLGQYQGYRNEENVSPKSQTNTFYAFKTEINTKKFKGVPIYIRAGKNLKETVTEISIIFKSSNVLIYRIQPNEGIVLKILTKKPGHKIEFEEQYMQFCYRVPTSSAYRQNSAHTLPDPYERLISDAIRGDQTFFNDAEEVEASWAFIDPLVTTKRPVFTYKPGSWGPKEADELIEEDGRKWLEPSMLFCRI